MGLDFVHIKLHKADDLQWRNYVWMRLPVYVKKSIIGKGHKIKGIESHIGEFQGTEITLPFSKDEALLYGEAFVKEYCKRVLFDYKSISVICPEIDELFQGENQTTYNPYMILFIMEELVERIRALRGISRKKLKILIIDGGNAFTDYIIDVLYTNLNFLKVSTLRPEYFEKQLEQIYEETGLVAELIQSPLKQADDSHIIINLQCKVNKDYNFFDSHASVIDLVREKKVIQCIKERRSSLQYYDDVKMTQRGKPLDLQLFYFILKKKGYLNTELNEENVKIYREQIKDMKEKIGLEIWSRDAVHF